jgi:hypothetical protein
MGAAIPLRQGVIMSVAKDLEIILRLLNDAFEILIYIDFCWLISIRLI